MIKTWFARLRPVGLLRWLFLRMVRKLLLFWEEMCMSLRWNIRLLNRLRTHLARNGVLILHPMGALWCMLRNVADSGNSILRLSYGKTKNSSLMLRNWKKNVWLIRISLHSIRSIVRTEKKSHFLKIVRQSASSILRLRRYVLWWMHNISILIVMVISGLSGVPIVNGFFLNL